MGNYMETCIQKKQPEEENPQQEEQQKRQKRQQGKQESGKTSCALGKESGTMRVKLVLTKDELQWLLAQMKQKQGRPLEEVLGEIENSRLTGKSVAAWKPSLESIMESPEVHHHMDRSS